MCLLFCLGPRGLREWSEGVQGAWTRARLPQFRLLVDGNLAAFLESTDPSGCHRLKNCFSKSVPLDECHRFTSHHNAAMGPDMHAKILPRFGKKFEVFSNWCKLALFMFSMI